MTSQQIEATTLVGVGSAGAWFVVAATCFIAAEHLRGRPSTSPRASIILRFVAPLVAIAFGLLGVWVLAQSGTEDKQAETTTIVIRDTGDSRPATSVKAGSPMIETTPRNELWESRLPTPLFRLTADGKTNYRIVLPAEPTSTERIAADELAKYLKQISGATFEVVDDGSPETDAEIVVGFGRRTDALLPDFDVDELGHDGFIIKTVGTRLIIAGGKKRGTMYGVYSFLEDVLGCRWWTRARQARHRHPADRSQGHPRLHQP